ncbi:hypothetical protein [uncultured Bacteroides sp.]|uniref:hypothetical protein n=1 Tax=uncultured Bacteroides sp. TaxID=162156 RepID=UPI0026113BE7|nr:hypothetical protein [uncultured Bacteroides sp.]
MIGAAIGAAASLAGSIFGGIKARKAAKRARKALDKADKENQEWYNRRYNEDYTQSAEAQAALTKARDYAIKQHRNARGAAAVGGATDESVAQEKAAAAQMMAGVTSDIASNATAQKNAIEQQYLSTKDAINNQRISIYNNQAQAATQAASQAMGAGMGMVGADLQSHLNNGKGMFESLFNKKQAN